MFICIFTPFPHPLLSLTHSFPLLTPFPYSLLSLTMAFRFILRRAVIKKSVKDLVKVLPSREFIHNDARSSRVASSRTISSRVAFQDGKVFTTLPDLWATFLPFLKK